jgi:hypothetical protein
LTCCRYTNPRSGRGCRSRTCPASSALRSNSLPTHLHSVDVTGVEPVLRVDTSGVITPLGRATHP